MDHLVIITRKDVLYEMSYLQVLLKEEYEVYEGILYTRQAIVDVLCDLEIYRPAHNIDCMQQQMQTSNGHILKRGFISPL